MSKTLFIPKGMETIDALAIQVSYARHHVEVKELGRLHDLAAEHLSPSVLSAVPNPHTRWRHDVFLGKVQLPISGDSLRLASPLWGKMDLANLSHPKSYVGNVGFIRFLRDFAVVVCGDGPMPGYPNSDRKVQVHYGGSSRFVADWRKSLYLLQLAKSEEYVGQFAGAGDGLDAFALRYFNGNRMKARSFAINIFSAAIFEKLEWKTARSARACIEYQDQRHIKREKDYEHLLSWALDLHGDEQSLSLEAFVQRLLRMDDDHRKRPAAARAGSAFRRFGRMYWSWRNGGVDTAELDEVFSQHGLGYHEAPTLYEEFVALARDKNFSTEQLSRIAIERRMLTGQVKIAYSPVGYQMLLEAFHEYGVETGELAPLLIKNAPAYIAGRILEWNELPRPRKSLFSYLGLTRYQDQSFPRWVRRYVGETEAEIVEGEYERAVAKNRRAVQVSSVVEDRRPFELSAKAAPRGDKLSLEVFEDLINDANPPSNVIERLEDVMKPLERISGPLSQIHLKRLRNIFARELGEKIVNAALEKAGLSVD